MRNLTAVIGSLICVLALAAGPARGVTVDLPSSTSQYNQRLIDLSRRLIRAVENKRSNKLQKMVHPEWGLTVWMHPGAMLVPTQRLRADTGNFSKLFNDDYGVLGESHMNLSETVRVRLGTPVEYNCEGGEGYVEENAPGSLWIDSPAREDTRLGSFVEFVGDNPGSFSPSAKKAAKRARELGFDYRLSYLAEQSTVRFFIKLDGDGKPHLVHLAGWHYCSA